MHTPLFAMHAPRAHTPPLPCTPPFTMHGPFHHTHPLSPCMPPFTMHAPLCHACPPLPHMPPFAMQAPFTTHAPPLCHTPPSPRMPPSPCTSPLHHTHPLHGTTSAGSLCRNSSGFHGGTGGREDGWRGFRTTWDKQHEIRAVEHSGGSRISRGGCANFQIMIILQIFCPKLHENERIWTGGGRPSPSFSPPSATGRTFVKFKYCLSAN